MIDCFKRRQPQRSVSDVCYIFFLYCTKVSFIHVHDARVGREIVLFPVLRIISHSFITHTLKVYRNLCVCIIASNGLNVRLTTVRIHTIKKMVRELLSDGRLF